MGPSKYDPANPDINNDIKPQLDTTKTIESLNKQLEKNDMDGDKKADYTVKSITEDKMEIEYGAKFMQDKKDSNKPKTDTFTLEIDKASNMILPDSQQAGQVSQWKKVESAMIQDQDFTFDGEHKPETGKKIVYYAKSGIVAEGTAEFTIMNNIQKTVT